MRVRALAAGDDYSFGRGSQNFLKDSAAAVAQRVRSRLLLMTGEWFLDLTEGTDYAGSVLGKSTQDSYDGEFRSRIASTPGVRSILSYSSRRNATTRALTVTATIDTRYSAEPVTVTIP